MPRRRRPPSYVGAWKPLPQSFPLPACHIFRRQHIPFVLGVHGFYHAAGLRHVLRRLCPRQERKECRAHKRHRSRRRQHQILPSYFATPSLSAAPPTASSAHIYSVSRISPRRRGITALSYISGISLLLQQASQAGP